MVTWGEIGRSSVETERERNRELEERATAFLLNLLAFATEVIDDDGATANVANGWNRRDVAAATGRRERRAKDMMERAGGD